MTNAVYELHSWRVGTIGSGGMGIPMPIALVLRSPQKGDQTVAENTSTAMNSDTGELVQGILNDARRLIEQQFQLLRSDFANELGKIQKAGIALGGGAGLVAMGGILSTFTLVHLLHDTTRLPLWTCYAIVAGLLGAAGAGLLTTGIAEVSSVHLIPEQAKETLRQSADSVRQAVSRAGA